MVWGVDDVSHEIVGSKFYYRSARQGKEELENWLHHQMSENASFEFRELDVESTDPDVKPLHVTVLMVAAAIGHTVEFEKTAYIRIGSITKKLNDYPTVEAEVWDRITKSDFEGALAKGGLDSSEALSFLDYPKYFSLLNVPMPQDYSEVIHYLCDDELLVR